MKCNGYFTFQMIIDTCSRGSQFLSFDAVCVGSPVIIIFILQKVNKQVHKNWNFQLL